MSHTYRFCSKMEVTRKFEDGSRMPLHDFCSSHSDSSEVVALLRQRGHTLVEFLSGLDGELQYSKLYFDADRHVGKDAPSADDTAAFYNEVVTRMDRYMDILRPYTPGVSYVVAQRHGYCPKHSRFKLSLRTFVQGISIHHSNCPAFIRALDPAVNDRSIKDYSCFWDMSVYKRSEQMMCAINGKKGSGDTRVLEPLELSDLDDERILKYVVQHIEPDWFPVSFVDDADVDAVEEDGIVDGPSDDDRVVRLVKCLGQATADDRNAWIRVGMILKGLGGQRYYAAWLAFSRLGTKFKSANDCEKTWKTLRVAPADAPSPRILTIGTLCYFARCDDPVAYNAWRKKAPTMFECVAVSQNLEWDTRHVVQAAASVVLPAGEGADGDTWVDGGDVMFNKDQSEYRVRLSTLGVSSSNDESPRYIHGAEPGIACGPLVIPNTPAPAEGWTVSRPSQHLMLMKNGGTPRTDIRLDLAGESVRRVTVNYPDTNKKLTLRNNKALLGMIENVCRDAIKGHLQSALMVPVSVVNVIFNCTFAAGDTGESRTTDFAFLAILKQAGVLNDIVAISETEAYVFDLSSGLWVRGSINEAAYCIRESACSGPLKAVLSETDAAYLQSCDGPLKVLKSIISAFKDTRFVDRLNQLPDNCLAFDNVLVDASTGEARPFRREDYISLTIGYKYTPDDDEVMAAFITGFYKQVFPMPDEREYFLRIIATALFNQEQSKHFLVLTDERAGSNGKTTVMRAVESVFGLFTARAERDFLYETSNVNPNGAAANLLAFIDKRLAFFDEPNKDDGHHRMDIRKIKDLCSGDARIRGRALQANTVQEARWQALIVIACNESNFPKIDATDQPLMDRMKVVKMRGLFVGDKELAKRAVAEDDKHVYLLQTGGFKKRINVDARMAHMHTLIRAYQRFKGANGFGEEPACVKEMVDKIVESADPRIPKAAEFVDAWVDFKPLRKQEFWGKKFFAWITEKDLVASFWKWYRNYEHEDNIEFSRTMDKDKNNLTAWKAVLKTVMHAKGRVVRTIHPTVNGKQLDILAYDEVSWINQA